MCVCVCVCVFELELYDKGAAAVSADSAVAGWLLIAFVP